MVISFFQQTINSIQGSIDSLGFLESTLFRLIFFTFIILIYAIFVFYSYRFFSRKNIFEFNMRQYVNSEHPILSPIIGISIYLVEYVILLPFLVIIWFSFYSLFILLLALNLDIQNVLLIAASLIASIRISSFVSEKISQELAKLIPFTFLALALTGERFFSISFLLERFQEVPDLFSSIPIYLIFIALVEFGMRIFDAIAIFSRKE